MSREGFKLEKKEVREIINSEIEKHNIPITEKEQQTIDNIIDSCPKSPNTASLFVWCNKKVSEELNKYPDMNEDIQDIRNIIGKELRYKLDLTRFEKLREIIEVEKPEIITPQWIRDHFSALSASIRRGYKNIDGSVDWNFVSNKLGIKDRFSVRITESWNYDKEKIINSLNNLLEEKMPLIFSPKWIEINSSDIYHQLGYNFRTEDNKIDWGTIKYLINEKWQDRWKIKQRRGISMLEVVDNITRTFEIEKPKIISPKWIIEKLPNDYQFLIRILNRYDDKEKEFDYQPLLDLLPSNIVEHWKPFLKTSKIIPKELYSNISETDSIINKYKDKMYTFYTLIDKEKDRISREEIINDMREIIMKGNVDALDRLIDHLFFTVEQWIENDHNLKVWEYASDKLKEIIKRCIYRHDPSKGKFSTYLYVTLEKETAVIRINYKGENFTKRHVDGNMEYHENETF